MKRQKGGAKSHIHAVKKVKSWPSEGDDGFKLLKSDFERERFSRFNRFLTRFIREYGSRKT